MEIESLQQAADLKHKDQLVSINPSPAQLQLSASYPKDYPTTPTIVEGIEHKSERFGVGKDVRVYVWVDILGLKIVDAGKQVVQWSLRPKSILQWAVRNDYFWCRIIYKRGEQRQRAFLTGYSKAVKLKAAIETFVNIHLKDPGYARQLWELVEDPPIGGPVSDELVAQAEPFDTGLFRDPSLVTRYASRLKGGRPSTPGSVGQAPKPDESTTEDLPEYTPPPWVQSIEPDDEEAEPSTPTPTTSGAGGPTSPGFSGDPGGLMNLSREELVAKLEALQMNCDVYKAEMERLSQELAHAQQEAPQTSGASAQASVEAEAMIAELEGTVGALRGEVKGLKKELQAAKLEAAGRGDGAGNEEQEEWMAEKEVLMSMMEDKEVEVEGLEQEKANLEAELAQLRASSQHAVSSLQADSASVAAEKAALLQETAASKALAEDLQKRLAAKENELEMQALMFAQARSDMEEAAESRAIVTKGVVGLRSELEHLRGMKDDAKAQAAALAAQLPGAFALMFQEVKYFLASQNLAGIEEMQALYKREVAERKKYYNELVDIKGNIRVFCRVRPLLGPEKEDPEEDSSTIRFPMGDETIAVRSGFMDVRDFKFDRVFQPEESQEQVFVETKKLVTSVIDGYKVTIFAYGQTGSGKTHTMAGTDADPGVQLRALKELFVVAQKRSKDYDSQIEASILEIYNEGVYDLLNDKPHSKALDVRYTQADGVVVGGLTSRPVGSVEDVQHLVEEGNRHRSTSSTNMNEHSSRSHLMLSVYVMCTNKVTGDKVKGKLHLVDLAGSERLSRTHADGDRLKEAQAINKSLSALGDVIASLAQKTQHIPYRNSKLTQALQDSLGGSSKVLMFVNISPTTESAPESLCSLNFASRVRGVELGQAKVNREGGESPSPKTPATPRTPASGVKKKKGEL